jgi:hypothetical protein
MKVLSENSTNIEEAEQRIKERKKQILMDVFKVTVLMFFNCVKKTQGSVVTKNNYLLLIMSYEFLVSVIMSHWLVLTTLTYISATIWD